MGLREKLMAEQPSIKELLQKIEKLERDAVLHRQTKEALLKSEEQYRLVADNVTDLIWAIDMDMTHFKYISPSIKTMKGFPSQDSKTCCPLYCISLTPSSNAIK